MWKNKFAGNNLTIDDFKVYTKSLDRAKMKIMTDYLYEKLLEDTRWIYHEVPYHDDIEGLLEYCKNKSGKGKHKYIFITVNPEECPVDLFVKQTEKCMTKKWIRGYLYAYEWDKRDQVHVHMKLEIDENKKCYRCIGEVRNTYKKCGLTNIHHYYANDSKAFVRYILGWKKNKKLGEEVRKSRWETDVQNRRIYNMQEYYINNMTINYDLK